MIIHNVVGGERPGRPPGPNEWLSDVVWNFISRCWSASWDERPDVDFVINTLNDAADAVGAGRRRAYTTNDQGQGTTRRDSGTSCETDQGHTLTAVVASRSIRTRDYRGVEPVTHRLQKVPKLLRRLGRLLRPVVVRCKIACGLQGGGQRKKGYTQSSNDTVYSDGFVQGLRRKGFRMWQNPTGFYPQEGALLSSSDGATGNTRGQTCSRRHNLSQVTGWP